MWLLHSIKAGGVIFGVASARTLLTRYCRRLDRHALSTGCARVVYCTTSPASLSCANEIMAEAGTKGGVLPAATASMCLYLPCLSPVPLLSAAQIHPPLLDECWTTARNQLYASHATGYSSQLLVVVLQQQQPATSTKADLFKQWRRRNR